jgi:peroxiredoxin
LLAEGQPAPAFSLPRDGGQTVSLTSYAGRKLVIFFYPRADTPGCTLEAIAFSRLADDFAIAGTAILGVSADPVTKQDAFRDKHGLTVPLASDETSDAQSIWRLGRKIPVRQGLHGDYSDDSSGRCRPAGSRKSGAMSGSMGMPTLCWRLPLRLGGIFRKLTMKGSN